MPTNGIKKVLTILVPILSRAASGKNDNEVLWKTTPDWWNEEELGKWKNPTESSAEKGKKDSVELLEKKLGFLWKHIQTNKVKVPQLIVDAVESIIHNNDHKAALVKIQYRDYLSHFDDLKKFVSENREHLNDSDMTELRKRATDFLENVSDEKENLNEQNESENPRKRKRKSESFPPQKKCHSEAKIRQAYEPQESLISCSRSAQNNGFTRPCRNISEPINSYKSDPQDTPQERESKKDEKVITDSCDPLWGGMNAQHQSNIQDQNHVVVHNSDLNTGNGDFYLCLNGHDCHHIQDIANNMHFPYPDESPFPSLPSQTGISDVDPMNDLPNFCFDEGNGQADLWLNDPAFQISNINKLLLETSGSEMSFQDSPDSGQGNSFDSPCSTLNSDNEQVLLNFVNYIQNDDDTTFDPIMDVQDSIDSGLESS